MIDKLIGFKSCTKPTPSRPTAELRLRNAAIRLKANCAAEGQWMPDLTGKSVLTGGPDLDG